MTRNEKIISWLLITFIAIIAFLAIAPLLSLVLSSFRPSSELIRNGITLSVPLSELSLVNYSYIFTESSNYWTWYMNSIIVSALTIVLSLFFSSMVGYALAVYQFKARNLSSINSYGTI
jgi:arabinosaccharide transport system permease protein